MHTSLSLDWSLQVRKLSTYETRTRDSQVTSRMMNISVTTELLMAPEKSELRDWRDITLIHDVDVDEPLCCEEHVTGTGTGRVGGAGRAGIKSSSSYK